MRLPVPVTEKLGFHVILHGAGWLITAAGSPVRLRPGDIVLAPHGAEHGLSHTASRTLDQLGVMDAAGPPETGPADFDFVVGCYRLDQAHMHRFMRDLPRVIVISPDYDRDPQLRALIDVLAAEVTEDLPGGDAARPALVDLMLVHALRQVKEKDLAADWPEVTDPGIAAAVRQMHASPQRPWTVQQLGEVAGMSRTAFSRRFTALVGEPPMAYLIGRRLTRSARLLRETGTPLAAIARQVGYANEYAFSGAFRRKYGIAPGRFRGQVTAEPTRAEQVR